MDEEFNSRAAGQILGMHGYRELLLEMADAQSPALGNSYRWGGKMIPGWDWRNRERRTTPSSLTHGRTAQLTQGLSAGVYDQTELRLE